MRYKIFILSAVLLLGIGLTGLQAQEAIPASGGNASGSGGTVNYTVGQVVYTTNTGTNGSVAQGVQQPYEISVVSEIEQTKDIYLMCTIYPNPTTNFLTLKIENFNNKNLSYQLYDIQGKLLENKKMNENNTIIVMKNLVPAIYFLKVIKENKEIKIFKIIKN